MPRSSGLSFRSTRRWGFPKHERGRLVELLSSETPPPERYGQADYWYLMYQMTRLPEAEDQGDSGRAPVAASEPAVHAGPRDGAVAQDQRASCPGRAAADRVRCAGSRCECGTSWRRRFRRGSAVRAIPRNEIGSEYSGSLDSIFQSTQGVSHDLIPATSLRVASLSWRSGPWPRLPRARSGSKGAAVGDLVEVAIAVGSPCSTSRG